jgi:hypothetical protein
MLSKAEAQKRVEQTFLGATVKAWTRFQELFIFRVEWPMPLEEEWDPFVSVDVLTGETRDFSVLTNLTSSEFAELEWRVIGEGR